MSNVTEKQHYVWRKYLEAWCHSKGTAKMIWTYLKKLNFTNEISIKDVAIGRNFYKLCVLSSAEISFLRKFASTDPSIKPIVDDLLLAYYSFSHIHKEIEQRQALLNETELTGKIKSNIEDLKNQAKELEINTFEQIHCEIEKKGNSLINCSSIDSIKSLSDEEIENALFYLCIQYTRTKKMKDEISDSMSDRPELRDLCRKTWAYLSIVVGLQLCHSFIDQGVEFLFVKNNSDIPFITTDQPIINTFGADDGETTDLELFYPISPYSAIVVHNSSIKRQYEFQEILADEEYTIEHNELMWENSHEFIFANNCDILKRN